MNKIISIDKIIAFIIGLGIALFPIHNTWLTRQFTSGKEVDFFIPAFGMALWFMGTLIYAAFTYKEFTFGPKNIWIPMIVIVLAIGISGLGNPGNIMAKVSPLIMGISLFTLYLVSRKLGKDLFIPLAIGALIAETGVFIGSVLHPGIVSGGLVFEWNYDIVIGYICMGAALYFGKYRWIFAGVTLIAVLLTGSPEGLFVTGVVVIVAFLRKDWSEKIIFVTMGVIVLLVVMLGLGWFSKLYDYTGDIITDQAERPAVNYRWQVAKQEMEGLQPLGDGYMVTEFKHNTIHNVPLVIVQQMGYPGILAGLAWIWITIYCLWKTRWKYAWVLILALSVFDHFIWTQMSPVWWAVAGASTVNLQNDYIFKGS